MSVGPHSVSYRADVDGLRAVAVLAVVFYHALPWTAPGGFVGVDIFFVISGFIITRLIAREIEAGQFSILDFYERRLRRIMPALLTVWAFTLCAGFAVFLPDDLARLGASLSWSVFFAANFYFNQETDYFGAPADDQPLLHLWSLAVEEQFYVVFPLLFLALTRWMPTRRAVYLGLVAVLSFIASVWAVQVYPQTAFYLMPFRFWELALGALLAIGAIPAVGGRLGDALSLGGAGLLVASIWWIDSAMPFPGVLALMPCVGAALLIHAGPTATVNRVLSFGPVVWVGLISYSLYLWHWPLLFVGRYVALRPLTPAEAMMIVALSVILAALSVRYIEQPFRRRDGAFDRRAVFSNSALASMILLLAGGWAAMSHGVPSRLAPSTLALLNDPQMDVGIDPDRCTYEGEGLKAEIAPLRDSPLEAVCRVGDPDAPISVVLWGDSHAKALAPAVDEAARKAGIGLLVVERSACAPLLNVWREVGFRVGCERYNADVLAYLKAAGIRRVILAGRWAYFASGQGYGHEVIEPVVLMPETGPQHAAFEAGLTKTIERLDGLGIETALVTQVPELGYDIFQMTARAQMLGRVIAGAPTRSEYSARQRPAADVIYRVSMGGGVSVLEVEQVFCGKAFCPGVSEARPLYHDDDHLNRLGAERLVPTFDALFATFGKAAS